MPFTEVPDIARQIRGSITITQEISPNMVKTSPPYSSATCFVLSQINYKEFYRESPKISDLFTLDQTFNKQLALLALSQQLFQNSQHLDEVALNVMNKTSVRLFSKTPTRL